MHADAHRVAKEGAWPAFASCLGHTLRLRRHSTFDPRIAKHLRWRPLVIREYFTPLFDTADGDPGPVSSVSTAVVSGTAPVAAHNAASTLSQPTVPTVLCWEGSWLFHRGFIIKLTGGKATSFYTTVGQGRARWRYVDSYDEATRTINETKTGYVRYSKRIERQIEKDADIVADPAQPAEKAVWHLLGSDRSGTMGADPRVIGLLQKHGIPYVIYPPG